ncbi:hypothetical protein [Porphyromonas gulae]|uniref:Uncharacterized protein n=1 Tax=Porphyromonas gulae TaxID=111105 RepID=A0A0A2F9H5_9PORP|nr:hypothetical protein [Porphyromonas gulae]KGN86695.1 hypothetical protein HR08_03410 [Porphyromonas gulae]
MNFSFYILGTPEGRYSQYPDDYTSSIYINSQERMAGARLVIYREMDLVHYIYIEKISKDSTIGFCLIFNKAYFQKPTQLIKLFRHIIEKQLIESGELIRYTENGELEFNIKSLNLYAKGYNHLKDYINAEFEDNPSKYAVEVLNTSFNGIRSEIELNAKVATDEQILISMSRHNKVLVNEDVGIEYGYIPQIIASLREQNQKAHEEVKFLQEENTVLDKKKKQYQYIVILTVIILLCCIGLYLFYEEIVNKSNKINLLETTVADQKRIINSSKENTAILNLKIKELKKQAEKFSHFSYTTGATFRNADNADNTWIMWLKAKSKVQIESFYVKGGFSSNGTVSIGLYDENDRFIASINASVSSSEFKKVYLDSGWVIDSGYYYIRIKESNSNFLQYHRSDEKEYGQFVGGALEISGCSSYAERSREESKKKHDYYQYFYNIQYKVLTK